MGGASLALQRGLVAALRGDAALMAVVSGVFDGPRPAAVLPYLTLGPDVVSDAGSKTGSGCEHRLTVSVWDEGPGVAGAKGVMALIEAAITGLSGALDGHVLVWARVSRSFTTADVEGATRGVLEIRARTEAV